MKSLNHAIAPVEAMALSFELYMPLYVDMLLSNIRHHGCPQCPSVLHDFPALKQHFSSTAHHRLFRCTVCKVTFKSWNALHQHWIASQQCTPTNCEPYASKRTVAAGTTKRMNAMKKCDISET